MRISKKHLALSLAGVMAVGVLVRSGRSEDKAPAMPAGMDPAMMEAMMKAAQPGPQHAALKKLAGTFDATVSMKMTPDAPEMTSKGTLVSQMIYGDRYLKSDYTGDMMGQAFKGMSIVGYDNMAKKYVSFWMDDMSTGPMMVQGTGDDAAKTVTYSGEMLCPANGQMMAFREVIKIDDSDHYSVEMFQKDPASGKEFRGMEIKYSRAK